MGDGLSMCLETFCLSNRFCCKPYIFEIPDVYLINVIFYLKKIDVYISVIHPHKIWFVPQCMGNTPFCYVLKYFPGNTKYITLLKNSWLINLPISSASLFGRSCDVIGFITSLFSIFELLVFRLTYFIKQLVYMQHHILVKCHSFNRPWFL